MARKLITLSQKFPVVAVLGPRQSGKTTLVKTVFADKEYISLEEPDRREFASTDPRGFLAGLREGAILDEIQRVPSLFSYLQTLVDSRQEMGQFILTGSHNYLLQENISQTLAGRVAFLKLLLFSLEELQTGDIAVSDPETLIYKGFYPPLYDRDISPADWYPNYIMTYIERDVRLIKNITDLDAFQRFVKMCAGRIGQLLNLSSLGDDCGITHNTAKAWLSVLEASYIVFLLRPYYHNFNKRLVKTPKLYFFDPGLACALLGIENSGQLSTHYLKGGLFENFIIGEIIKYRLNRGLEPNVYFWRDQTGVEVDCLVEAGGRLLPVEIKSGRTISADYFQGLECWYKLSGAIPGSGSVVYAGEENQTRCYGRVLSYRNFAALMEH